MNVPLPPSALQQPSLEMKTRLLFRGLCVWHAAMPFVPFGAGCLDLRTPPLPLLVWFDPGCAVVVGVSRTLQVMRYVSRQVV